MATPLRLRAWLERGYVYRESYDALKALHDAGYSSVLTGHSLGAGVASLTAVLLKESGKNTLRRLRGAGLCGRAFGGGDEALRHLGRARRRCGSSVDS